MRKVNNVIHELGHAFNQRLGGVPASAVNNYSAIIERETWSMNSRDPERYGFYEDRPIGVSGTMTWVQSIVVNGSEVFADMFIGWVYNRWENSEYGTERRRFMDTNMEGWIRQAIMRGP
ncbi:MAG: hypothetical protein ABIJ39_10110 [Chloroflexota bacterium]